MSDPTFSFDPNDIQENKWIASLSYIWLLFLIPLLWKKHSAFSQAHAKQGLILYLTGLIVPILGFIAILTTLIILATFGIFADGSSGLDTWPLFAGGAILSVFTLLLSLAHLIAFIKCLLGNFWEVPILGKYRHRL